MDKTIHISLRWFEDILRVVWAEDRRNVMIQISAQEDIQRKNNVSWYAQSANFNLKILSTTTLEEWRNRLLKYLANPFLIQEPYRDAVKTVDHL